MPLFGDLQNSWTWKLTENTACSIARCCDSVFTGSVFLLEPGKLLCQCRAYFQLLTECQKTNHGKAENDDKMSSKKDSKIDDEQYSDGSDDDVQPRLEDICNCCG